MSFNRKLLLLIALATGLLVLTNELNLSWLNHQFPEKNGLITTADEASYFVPADNFLAKGVWKDNQQGLSAWYTRTPGYGFIYLICKLIVPGHPFSLLKIIQILAFSAGIYFFANILRNFGVRDRIAICVSALYALLPCYSGFVYYTLSESLAVFFLLGMFYYALKARQGRHTKSLVLCVCFAAFLLLVRPQLIVFPLLILLWLFLQAADRKKALYFLLAFLPLAGWQVRNTVIAGHYPGFHPIYDDGNHSLFRPPHEALTDLFRTWEHDGPTFHFAAHQLAYNAENGLAKALATVPERYKRPVSGVLLKYQQLFFDQHGQPLAAADTLRQAERNFIVQTKALNRYLRAENPADYYLLTPAKSTKALLGTSMMNLYIFQGPGSSFFLIKLLKLLCFGVIIFSLVASVCVYFLPVDQIIRWTAMGVHISLFYLCFFQRMNEERYLLPYLPLLLFCIAAFIQKLPVRPKTNRQPVSVR